MRLKCRNAFAQMLKEGYLEMVGESEQIMRDFKHLDRESLKYVD